MAEHKTFEELYPRIEKVVEGFRGKWKFKASVESDFDDIKSEILVHIWKKWHLYNQELQVEGWAATITKNQFNNKLRDIYLKTSSPCGRCACNIGGELCSQFGIQGIECPLYKKWYNKKRYSHEAKMPLALELHINEVENSRCIYFDYDGGAAKLHKLMEGELTERDYKIYVGLFIMNKEEQEVSDECHFNPDSGIKRIRQIKAMIIDKARKVIAREGL